MIYYHICFYNIHFFFRPYEFPLFPPFPFKVDNYLLYEKAIPRISSEWKGGWGNGEHKTETADRVIKIKTTKQSKTKTKAPKKTSQATDKVFPTFS